MLAVHEFERDHYIVEICETELFSEKGLYGCEESKCLLTLGCGAFKRRHRSTLRQPPRRLVGLS
jgi:hypothetical protein